MKNLKNSVSVLLLLVLPLLAGAQATDSLRVLFVGNSFTFYWNLPQVVEAMAGTQDFPMVVRQSTASGATWQQHWNGEKGLKTKALIEQGNWDIVVLQDHSTSPIDEPVRFREYGKKLADLVRASGAEPLFFMTWAYHSNPLQQPALTEGYRQLATGLGAEVVTAGPIWSEVRKWRPDIDMFADDKHPSPDATYLTGLAFFKKLSGRSVTDIPDRLWTTDTRGDRLYLAIIDPETGAFFRQLVETFTWQGTPKKEK